MLIRPGAQDIHINKIRMLFLYIRIRSVLILGHYIRKKSTNKIILTLASSSNDATVCIRLGTDLAFSIGAGSNGRNTGRVSANLEIAVVDSGDVSASTPTTETYYYYLYVDILCTKRQTVQVESMLDRRRDM